MEARLLLSEDTAPGRGLGRSILSVTGVGKRKNGNVEVSQEQGAWQEESLGHRPPGLAAGWTALFKLPQARERL